MSPAPSATAPALATEAMLPARVLEEGELVILAIRPHPLSVLLVSLPVVAVSALIWIGVYITEGLFRFPLPSQGIALICVFSVLLRLLLASFQWAGRLYLLTTRRVLWVNGISTFNVVQCPLHKVHDLRLSLTTPERMAGLGSLHFTFGEDKTYSGSWINISKPRQVLQTVQDAISRVR